MEIKFRNEEVNLKEQISPIGDVRLSVNDIIEGENKLHLCTLVDKDNTIVKSTVYNFNKNTDMEIEKVTEINGISLHSILTTLLAIYGVYEKSDGKIIDFSGIKIKIDMLVPEDNKLNYIIVVFNEEALPEQNEE